MSPLLFDIIILALVLLSVALGFMRGFVNEVFTIFGWIAAIVATIYFTPVLRPYGRELIHKEWLADLATSSAIFLITLAVFSGLGYFATRTLHASKLGIIDRSAGFIFGIFRAVVLLGLAYMLFTFTYSKEENRPDFVNEARTRPFLEASSAWLQAVLPMEDLLGSSDADKEKDDKETDVKKDDKNDLGEPGAIGEKLKEGIQETTEDLSEKAKEVSKETNDK